MAANLLQNKDYKKMYSEFLSTSVLAETSELGVYTKWCPCGLAVIYT